MSLTFLLPFVLAAPPDAACSLHGASLFAMTARSDLDSSSTTTTIFESGAWTITTGKRIERGCFDKSELRAIRRAVQRAPWKTTSSSIRCFAYDPAFVEYRVHGRLRFTERMCGGTEADALTVTTIAFVKAEVAEERQPPTRNPSPMPSVNAAPPPPRP